MKRPIITLFVAMTLSLGISSVGSANTIYSTFGPGDSYNSSSGPLVGVQSDGFYQYIAEPFNPSVNANLGSIEVAVRTFNSNESVEFNFSLISDLDDISGSLIESFSFSNVPLTAGILYQESTLNPLLLSSSQYWLVATAGVDNELVWFFNDIGLTGSAAKSPWTSDIWSYNSDATKTAFRLNASPVPEPSTFLLLGGGLAGLAFYTRRRRKE